MAMTLKMLNREEFVPENGVEYALFTVCKFYGTFEFEYMTAEFHFSMIDAEDGHPLPSSVCYNGQDEIPFDVPVLYRVGMVDFVHDKPTESGKYGSVRLTSKGLDFLKGLL